MPSRTRRTPSKVKKNGTQTLPAPPETAERRRKGTVSGRRSNERQDSNTSDEGDKGKQHSDTRMEGRRTADMKSKRKERTEEHGATVETKTP